YLGPSSRDPANLEVAIAVDVRDRKEQFLDEAVLRALYAPPLLPPGAAKGGESRVEAIRQIRVHAAGDGISAGEYEFSVACHLLRFARFPTPPGTADAALVDR